MQILRITHSSKLSPLLRVSLFNYQRYICTSNHVYNNNKGFFGKFVENIRSEFDKNKEMRENIKKFKDEKRKLEQSDALRQARKKFETIEAETSKNTEQIKKQLDAFKSKINQTVEGVSNTELGKQVFEGISSHSKNVKETFGKSAEHLSQSQTVHTIKRGVKSLKEEVEDSTLPGSRMYTAPIVLRKRSDYKLIKDDERVVEANEDATGVELHKDSKWFNSWNEFKDNNAYFKKMSELKYRYDESDNSVVRVSKMVTDRFTDLFSNLFSTTELSDVLTEICKVDPNFDKNDFLRFCETDIIPNVLEAIIRGDLDVLNDWCHEAVFNAISTPIKEAKKMKYKFCSRILDIENVELALGKIMEQGPVLVITFQAQQIMVIRDEKDNLVEGDPNKVQRVHYVWVLCRDQNEFDPKAAWRLLDISAQQTDQFI